MKFSTTSGNKKLKLRLQLMILKVELQPKHQEKCKIRTKILKVAKHFLEYYFIHWDILPK